MKLTKGMKKALSLVLAGALVITGANFGTVAKAEGEATGVVKKAVVNIGADKENITVTTHSAMVKAPSGWDAGDKTNYFVWFEHDDATEIFNMEKPTVKIDVENYDTKMVNFVDQKTNGPIKFRVGVATDISAFKAVDWASTSWEGVGFNIPYGTGEATIQVWDAATTTEPASTNYKTVYTWEGSAHGDCSDAKLTAEVLGHDPVLETNDAKCAHESEFGCTQTKSDILAGTGAKAGYGCGIDLINQWNDAISDTTKPKHIINRIADMKMPAIKVTTANDMDAYSWDWEERIIFPSDVIVPVPGLADYSYFALFGGEDTITKVEVLDLAEYTGDMKGFEASLYYSGADWSGWAVASTYITGNGNYEMTIPVTAPAYDTGLFYLQTDIRNGFTVEGFKIAATKAIVTDAEGNKTEYEAEDKAGLWGLGDQNMNGCYRLNARNFVNALYDESQVNMVDNTIADAFKDAYIKTVADGTITLQFTVSGMDPAGTAITLDSVEKVAASTTPNWHPDPNASTGGDDTTGGNGNSGSNNGGSSNGGNTVVADSVKVAKSSVIVAAGKTAKVGFTASKTPTVKSSNKKVTAKVDGKNIKITVNKKAVKGSTATITVTAGTKKATIKVTVQNKAKKVKAAKKSVTIKKKGKTVKATFKVTATNKKKAVADTIKVTSKNKKVAKVTKTKVSKGKVVLTIKGLKKGKSVVTLKIGKKSAKVTVKVKK